jgi:small neutral amino acid transporter SnatA (MarC family)
VGLNVLRAFSKLVMVLLAAIAVNFIRSGITNVIHGR